MSAPPSLCPTRSAISSAFMPARAISEIAVWRSQWKRKSPTTIVRPSRFSLWASPAARSAGSQIDWTPEWL
jgi:hypothetical protein